MGKSSGGLGCKLRLLALLSSLMTVLGSMPLAAHEVTPTIGDFSVLEGQLLLDLRLNVEAFVAGIDLDGQTDTNETDQSSQYDELRALDPDELMPMVQSFAERWIDRLEIDAAGRVSLRVTGIEIPEVGDPELPRSSRLLLTGIMPAGANSLILRWPDGAGDLVLRQQGVPEPFTGYVEGGGATPPIPLAGGSEQTGWQTFGSYVPVGFDHILPKGLDHILFVLGLYFLSTNLGSLLWLISAFTLAHTVTLALGALGWVYVPPGLVEPMIALSIVYVAVENILQRGFSRWRPVVVFCFGLLHGLGFASVLGEFGLPSGQFIPALLGFNVGVELGQLTVIVIAFLTVGLWFRNKSWYRARIAVPASVVIAMVGAYWFTERVFI